MNLIVKVSSSGPRAPLSDLLSLPMDLDVWEVKPDYLVLRAEEPQVDRLQQMGYVCEQLQDTASFLDTFATTEAIAGYHSAETLEQDLKALADSKAEFVELVEIGRSIENRPIWALRIAERKGNKRKVLFMGCHHAREWIAVEVPYLLAEYLVNNASTDPVKQWISKMEIWVMPMVNPDGHEHCRTNFRLWRKNRRPNPDGSFGVDPNRNYGYMWGTLNVPTSSHVPSDETYVGPRAFSEPETRACRDLIARELFSGVITYHSYSQLILYPWGFTSKPIVDPADLDRIESLAKRMQQLIKNVHDMTYVAKQSSKLYPTAGDTTDWTYGVYGIPSYTIELRPQDVTGGGFVLPADQIVPTFEENRPAALDFIEQIFGS